jgi:hypothetical protein
MGKILCPHCGKDDYDVIVNYNDINENEVDGCVCLDCEGFFDLVYEKKLIEIRKVED